MPRPWARSRRAWDETDLRRGRLSCMESSCADVRPGPSLMAGAREESGLRGFVWGIYISGNLRTDGVED